MRIGRLREHARGKTAGVELERVQQARRGQGMRKGRLSAFERAVCETRLEPIERASQQDGVGLGVIGAERVKPARNAVVAGAGDEFQMRGMRHQLESRSRLRYCWINRY